MKDRYIVYVQDMNDTHRVEMIFGVFNSYGRADTATRKLRKHYADDNRFWIGIRALNPMPKD